MEKDKKNTILSTRLKGLRKSHRISQSKLSDLTGISASTIAQYETGVRQPKIDKLQTLGDFFGVSVAYLSGETDDPSPATPTLEEIVRSTEQLDLDQLYKLRREALNGDKTAQKAVERQEDLLDLRNRLESLIGPSEDKIRFSYGLMIMEWMCKIGLNPSPYEIADFVGALEAQLHDPPKGKTVEESLNAYYLALLEGNHKTLNDLDELRRKAASGSGLDSSAEAYGLDDPVWAAVVKDAKDRPKLKRLLRTAQDLTDDQIADLIAATAKM